MPYVVKVMAYLKPDGRVTSNLKQAQRYDDKELAEAASLVADGTVCEVKQVIDIPQKDTPAKKQEKEKSNQKKSNQSWMRGKSNGL